MSFKKIRSHLNHKNRHRIRKAVHPFLHFKYPKFFILILMIVVAYFLFRNPLFSSKISSLENLSYLGIFIAGIFLSFGFSAPLAVGFFIVISPENIFLVSLVGGLGGMFANFLTFKSIKFSFMDEFYELEETKIMREASKLIREDLGMKIKTYLIYILAGILLASPLPDEIGVAMLAGLTQINEKIFYLISLVLHVLGVFLILLFSAL